MDPEYLLVTPENTPISFSIAGLGSRFVAAFLDAIFTMLIELGILALLVFLSWLTSFATAEAGSREASVIMGAIMVVLFSAILLGYPLLFEILLSGQTPGKRIAGIRVVKLDGSPITATAAVIRNLVRLVDFLPAYYIIGVVVMLVDRKSRRLGDMAAGTICIKERSDLTVKSLFPVREAAAREETDPASDLANLDSLTYEDCYLVKEFLLREDDLAPGPALSLAKQIAARIAAKLGVELGDELPEEFLERVAAALERRGSR